MPSWPRDVLPQSVSPFVMPGALQSWGQSGRVQTRATVQVGRMWSESYPPFRIGSSAGRKLVATINNFWRNGTRFSIDHRAYLTPNGGGTGTPRINGAGQTGNTIDTDGWTGANPVLMAGDILAIAGITRVFDVVEDAPNLVGGACALTINPPIFVGESPADDALITRTGVLLTAVIADAPNIPMAGPDQYIAGLTITFRETP